MSIKFYTDIDSPKTGNNWIASSEANRIEKINEVIDRLGQKLRNELLVVAAKDDGQVIVRIINALSASARGTLLLDYEECLKKYVDQGITVWGESLGDKNSLRNLRGIEVKVL